MYLDLGENLFLPRGVDAELDTAGDRRVVRVQFHNLATGRALVEALRKQLDALEIDLEKYVEAEIAMRRLTETTEATR